jgi:hypothetical protein
LNKEQKLEYRNPKFETNLNDQKAPNSKQALFGFGDLFLPWGVSFVSDFDIRISTLKDSQEV